MLVGRLCIYRVCKYRGSTVSPATEAVEDPVNEIEDGIMATYLRNEADEPEADTPLAIPPPVTPHEALAHIEGLYKRS